MEDIPAMEGLRRLARQEGFFICPEGAALVAAAAQLRASGWIKPHEKVRAVSYLGIEGYRITSIQWHAADSQLLLSF